MEMARVAGNIPEFLTLHPVFTLEDLQRSFGLGQASDLIFYYKKKQRIGVVKEGLYFAVKPGSNPRHRIGRSLSACIEVR
jgi:hypothetical protein